MGLILERFIPSEYLKEHSLNAKGGKQNITDDEISHLSPNEWSQWKENNKDQKLRIKKEEKRRANANTQKRKSRGY